MTAYNLNFELPRFTDSKDIIGAQFKKVVQLSLVMVTGLF